MCHDRAVGRERKCKLESPSPEILPELAFRACRNALRIRVSSNSPSLLGVKESQQNAAASPARAKQKLGRGLFSFQNEVSSFLRQLSPSFDMKRAVIGALDLLLPFVDG